MRVIGSLFLVALFMIASGCGSSDPLNRQAVSGTVKVKGKDVVYGRIEFAPNEGQQTPLTLEIREGKYSVGKVGGLAPGKFTVRFTAFDSAPPPAPDIPGNPTGPQPKDITPVQYGAQSKEAITVKVGDKNEFTFDLK